MNYFSVPQEAINWAQSRIELAVASFQSYAQNDAFAFFTEFDDETGGELKKVRLAKPLPADVSHLLRNAIVDLKHSFDQSLFAAAQTWGCTRFDKNYPWADSPNGLQRIIAKRQRQRDGALPPQIIQELMRQQPHGTGPTFSGGDDLVRDIAKMANQKHNIGFRVAASITGVTVKGLTFGRGGGGLFSPWNPQKQEMVIARIPPGGSFTYQNATLTAHVFFEGRSDISSVPAFEAIIHFSQRAQFALNGFKAACEV